MDIRIGEVVTDMIVNESVGTLSAEEVKRIVTLVLDQVRREQDQRERRQRDTKIADRVSQF